MNHDSFFEFLKRVKASSDKDPRIQRSRDFVKELCESFDVRTEKYDPQSSFDIINRYVQNENRLSRILYSEISQNIFQSDSEGVGRILTNIEHLMEFSLTSVEVNDNSTVVDIVLRVYDHIHLADIQENTIETIAQKQTDFIKRQNEELKKEVQAFQKQLEEMHKNYEKKVEKAQQNYVTVLGLFIAILVATGGIFVESSSIFNNAMKMSAEKLVLSAFITAAIIGNFIFFMAGFIARISGIEVKEYHNWWKYFTASLALGCVFSYGIAFLIEKFI